MRALVTVSSKHGSTEGIGRAIAEVLESAGVGVDLIPPSGVGSLHEYDAVVVGSALYMGRWMAPARDFVQGHADELRHRPVWLFASGPVTGVADDPYDAAEGLKLQGLIGGRDFRVFAAGSTGTDSGSPSARSSALSSRRGATTAHGIQSANGLTLSRQQSAALLRTLPSSPLSEPPAAGHIPTARPAPSVSGPEPINLAEATAHHMGCYADGPLAAAKREMEGMTPPRSPASAAF